MALRGNIKNVNSNDISLYLGPNFHFVVYPLNQKNEFNFISIIRKQLSKSQILQEKAFASKDFVETLTSEIYQKTSIDLKGKLENIKSFPIYVLSLIHI